jgi:hypothetical protein
MEDDTPPANKPVDQDLASAMRAQEAKGFEIIQEGNIFKRCGRALFLSFKTKIYLACPLDVG